MDLVYKEVAVFGRSFDVLSDILCEYDVMCFLLQGGAHLLGHALLLGHIRYVQYQDIKYMTFICHASLTIIGSI